MLGDKLRYVVSGAEVLPQDRWWDQMTSALASMDESRAVDAYAVINGFSIQTVDLEAAYLQADWPWKPELIEKQPEKECFVALPPELVEFLPKELRNPNGYRRPLWRILKPGYGHPASGHLWCDCFRKWLLEKGWCQIGRPGKGCLFWRGDCMLGSWLR